MAATEKKEDPMWFYKDPNGAEHGPFAETNMREWYNGNYFKPDLLIKSSDDKEFMTLELRQPSFAKPKEEPAPAPAPTPEVVETKQEEPKPVAVSDPAKTVEETPKIQNIDLTNISRKRKLDESFVEPAPKKIKAKVGFQPVQVKLEEKWLYLDSRNNIQGPFETSQMRAWYESGSLHGDLPIKLFVPGLTSTDDKSAFIALKDYEGCKFTVPLAVLETKLQEALQKVIAKKARKKKKKIPTKWYYRDPESIERGPYSLGIMRQWYSKDYIPTDTPVRGEKESNWINIGNRKQVFEDKQNPKKQRKKQSVWTYIDDNGEVQGPFEKFVLKSWHDFGWLPFDIRVKKQGEPYYIPWGDRLKNFDVDTDEENERKEEQNKAQLEKLRPKSEDEQWYYKDDEGSIQGPFSAPAMQGWFEDGFFVSNTLTKLGEEEEFVELKKRTPQPKWITVPYPDEPVAGALPVNQFQMVPRQPVHKVPPQFQRPPPVPPQQTMWFYMAAGDKGIGPFPLLQIQTWHRDGHFNDQVKVSRAETPEKWELIVNTPCSWKNPLPPVIPPIMPQQFFQAQPNQPRMHQNMPRRNQNNNNNNNRPPNNNQMRMNMPRPNNNNNRNNMNMPQGNKPNNRNNNSNVPPQNRGMPPPNQRSMVPPNRPPNALPHPMRSAPNNTNNNNQPNVNMPGRPPFQPPFHRPPNSNNNTQRPPNFPPNMMNAPNFPIPMGRGQPNLNFRPGMNNFQPMQPRIQPRMQPQQQQPRMQPPPQQQPRMQPPPQQQPPRMQPPPQQQQPRMQPPSQQPPPRMQPPQNQPPPQQKQPQPVAQPPLQQSPQQSPPSPQSGTQTTTAPPQEEQKQTQEPEKTERT